MKVEHVAWQVKEPAQVAAWYVDHLGYQIKRAMTEPPYTHFIADESGHGIIEFYNNPAAPIPDYGQQDPLVLHLAFVSEDLAEDRARLLKAGATSVTEIERLPNGDELVMLRDPWGFPIQLAKRGQAIL